MQKYLSFETERLLLIPTNENDAEFVFVLLNTPKWLKYIGDRKVYSVDDAKKYIKTRMISQLDKLGFCNYTVIRKSDKAKMGLCGLYNRDGLDGIDIGFAFLSEYEGKGYAFEAAKRIKEAALKEFNLECINAITTKYNLASQKLIEKLGLKFIQTITLPNDAEELLLYRIENNNVDAKH